MGFFHHQVEMRGKSARAKRWLQCMSVAVFLICFQHAPFGHAAEDPLPSIVSGIQNSLKNKKTVLIRFEKKELPKPVRGKSQPSSGWLRLRLTGKPSMRMDIHQGDALTNIIIGVDSKFWIYQPAPNDQATTNTTGSMNYTQLFSDMADINNKFQASLLATESPSLEKCDGCRYISLKEKNSNDGQPAAYLAIAANNAITQISIPQSGGKFWHMAIKSIDTENTPSFEDSWFQIPTLENAKKGQSIPYIDPKNKKQQIKTTDQFQSINQSQ